MTTAKCGHAECRQRECDQLVQVRQAGAVSVPRGVSRRNPFDILAILLGLVLIVFAISTVAFRSPAHAADAPLVPRGAGVVTTFSGTAASGKGAKGEHPQDHTLIDPSGAALRVLDLTNLNGAPAGQLSDAPEAFKVDAGQIGQVFGVALAEPEPGVAPDIYAAATSLFGLQIVTTGKDGKITRLVRGAANARWAPGQFGLEAGGGPGTVWKIDGTTGAVTPFADIQSGTSENSGPGLGAIAFDPVSRQLFVPSLETGLIHRLDLTGRELGVFDHGLTARGALGLPQAADDPSARMDIHNPAFNIEDPSTWGYADKKRRVTAVTIEDGRLYYPIADGPSVWSVGILADGSFANDARLEFEVTGTPDNGPITGLAFDGPHLLYLTQRGDPVGSYDYATLARPRSSVVYRYTWDNTAKAWKEAPEEYAIGMPSPHRATNGGLALTYGYDATGHADFSRCRETLWTTGEGLRAGSNGGLIDGLQGTATSGARPASAARVRTGSQALQGDFGGIESDLEPPADSWFIDAGGADDGGHGQVGALAVYAPCDGDVASSEEPLRPAVPIEPVGPEGPHGPHGPIPGLAISKFCHPAPLGGVITCTITITNTGWTLSGPAGFTDVSKVLTGPDTGAAVLITSATPDGGDWFCSPTPTSLFSCGLPPGALLPGQSRSVDVRVDTAPLVAAGNSGFRNCAALDLPWSDKACVDSQTQIVVKKTAPASCMPGAPCAFGLTVTNSGSADFSGNILLSDSLFMDGGAAPVAAPIIAIAPPLGCGPDPVVLPFSCVAPIALAAGQSKAFTVTALMPALPANYWAHNCFSGSAPGQPPPVLPPGPGVDPSAVSCAWVPVGAPPPLANLRVAKSPLTCDKAGADTVRCHYEIAIKNTGPSPSVSPVTFTETLPASSTLASIAAPWACVGGPPAYTCTTAAAPIIAPGATVTIPVAIDFERDPLEVAKCWAPNKVALTAPVGGTANNFDATDDTATATADASWIRFDEGGPLELVLCDPTNLRTTKVADGPCEEDGGGYRCSFTVTITNTGPDPFTGRIDVTDAFSSAPLSATFGAGWDCGGAGANWTCSHPPMTLALNASVSLTVTAKLPKSSQCVVSNRATMIFPPANTRWNKSGADDSATAVSTLPSPDCKRAPVCEKPADGETRTASGACACAEGFARNRKGVCVPVDPETPSEPEAPIPAPECDRNEMTTASGQCVCRPGYSRSSGRCISDEPGPEDRDVCELGPNEVHDGPDRCVCRAGFSRARSGRCVPAIYLCIPGPHEHRTPFNQCVCNPGFERGRFGRCIPARPETCPPGMRGKPPTCKPMLCNEGMIGKWPNCKPMSCPPGTTGRPPRCTPVMTCPKGTFGTPPNCKPVDKPHCPAGQFGTPPNCKAIEVPKCPPGMVGRPPNCKKVEIPKCPPGTFGNPPNCKKIEIPKCGPGMIGTPPNCKKVEIPKCPPGTFGRPPNCKKVEILKCPAGTVGRPPRCLKPLVPCKKGEFRNAQGQCVARKVETPPKVILKTPKAPPQEKGPDIR